MEKARAWINNVQVIELLGRDVAAANPAAEPAASIPLIALFYAPLHAGGEILARVLTEASDSQQSRQIERRIFGRGKTALVSVDGARDFSRGHITDGAVSQGSRRNSRGVGA